MPHNKPVNMAESQDYAHKSLYAIEHAREGEQGTPSMVKVFDRPVKNDTTQDLIEITQQQVSRAVAVILLGAALIFFVGYTMGKYYVAPSRPIQSDIQSVLRGMFFEECDANFHASEVTDLGVWGCFATLEEADKVCNDLKKSGKSTKVIPRCSSTGSGREFRQYLVYTDKETVSNDSQQGIQERHEDEVQDSENNEERLTS